MSDPRLLDRRGPAWFDFARRVIVFVVGIATILVAVFSAERDASLLITGLILTSVIPVEDALRQLGDDRRDPDR